MPTQTLPGRTRPPSLVWDNAELTTRCRDGADPEAREELFTRFMPLARKLAARYSNPHEPIEDLVQVASIGLLGAIDRFDPDRGVRFPAFAIPTILGELKRYFRNTGWSAHVPRGAQELALRVNRATREIEARSGAQPSVAQLGEYLELPLEDVLVGVDAGTAHYSVSLDAPVSLGDDEEQPDTLGDSLGDVDDSYGLVEASMSLSAALDHLPHLERRALTLRLEGDMKQTEIARELGCSQMQVSRLLRRAASRLRALTDPDLAVPAEDDAPSAAGEQRQLA
ncbi:MAG TPA: sigma-70 family RNA polymerase sigma factor [Solirubrobacteraceae bacterium]|nr:sigma-70 family RNA polymerase sigma factor [Solirubrobacteraceae bacterium]